MGRFRIAFLTSSRADFSINLPVIRRLQQDEELDVELIVFGSQTSTAHGYTRTFIEAEGFSIAHAIDTLSREDTPAAIVGAQADTMKAFAELWAKTAYELVFCLGDRFEMWAAVMSGVPFGVRFAHIHGGEVSLGAIDNVYRDCISLASSLHFASCEHHAQRLRELLVHKENIFVSGAPALDNLRSLQLLDPAAFKERLGIDPSEKTILVTLHPETVHPEANTAHIRTFIHALEQIPLQLLITKANADTMGNLFNNELERFSAGNERVTLVDTLGPTGYYSAIQLCALVVGNSSSGIVEAASFGKYVVDVGDRQKGRMHGENVFHCPFGEKELVETINRVLEKGTFRGKNIFDTGNAAERIHTATKTYLQTHDQ